MAKRIITVLALAAMLAALPSCEQRREDDDSSALQGDQGEPEFVVAVVIDVSGSYLSRIQGDSPQAYKFFMKLTTAYANDRGESGDRILISQISQAEIPLLYEGTPPRLRRDFPGPDAFRQFVLGRSNPNGSRVYAGVAAAVERVLQFPAVQAGTTRSAVFVLSDMDDNAADGSAQKKRLLEVLGRYAKVRHSSVGFYWVDQNLAAEWGQHLTDAGVKHFVVEPDFVADPPLPTFD